MQRLSLLTILIVMFCSSGCGNASVTESVNEAVAEAVNEAVNEAVYGPTNPTEEQQREAGVIYYGSAIELLPEKEKLYRELHADVWPEVLAAIKKANIRNYNIFVAELSGKRYLFSFFEYHGSDPAADFASIAADPTTSEKWWPITDGCQRRLPGTPDGSQWKSLEMLMHID